MKVYEQIANAVSALAHRGYGTTDSGRVWHEVVHRISRECLPSGSGFDSGTRIDLVRSTPNCLVLQTEFHHMDEHGCYDGWTSHTVRVRPEFIGGFSLTISGPDRNGIKDYIYDCVSSCLHEAVPESCLYLAAMSAFETENQI